MTTTIMFGVLGMVGTTALFFLIEKGLHREATKPSQPDLAQPALPQPEAEVVALSTASTAASASEAA